jgi:hypothetical protein
MHRRTISPTGPPSQIMCKCRRRTLRRIVADRACAAKDNDGVTGRRAVRRCWTAPACPVPVNHRRPELFLAASTAGPRQPRPWSAPPRRPAWFAASCYTRRLRVAHTAASAARWTQNRRSRRRWPALTTLHSGRALGRECGALPPNRHRFLRRCT